MKKILKSNLKAVRWKKQKTQKKQHWIYPSMECWVFVNENASHEVTHGNHMWKHVHRLILAVKNTNSPCLINSFKKNMHVADVLALFILVLCLLHDIMSHIKWSFVLSPGYGIENHQIGFNVTSYPACSTSDFISSCEMSLDDIHDILNGNAPACKSWSRPILVDVI